MLLGPRSCWYLQARGRWRSAQLPRVRMLRTQTSRAYASPRPPSSSTQIWAITCSLKTKQCPQQRQRQGIHEGGQRRQHNVHSLGVVKAAFTRPKIQSEGIPAK